MSFRSGFLDDLGGDVGWSMFEASPDAVVVAVTRSGEIVFVNDQASTMFGYDGPDLLGCSVDELLPGELRARHRADRTRYRAEPTVRAMGAGMELRALRRDRTEFFAEISLSPLSLGDEQLVVAAVRDVTDRVRAEDHLHRVLHTLDASDDAIFLFDAETLKYAYVNEGGVRLVGYDRSELLAMTPMHLNPAGTERGYRDLAAELLSDPTATIRREASLIHRDGTDIPVAKSYHAGSLGRDGSRWIVAVARDVSRRLAAEADLRQSQDLLREAESAAALGEERQRIAGDLHDTVIQRLFAAGLTLSSVASQLEPSARARLGAAGDEIDEGIRELRSTIFLLSRATHAGDDLRSLLLDAVRPAEEAGLKSRIHLVGRVGGIPVPVADQLVPTLREAIANVVQHARATRAHVSVSVDADTVQLSVRDDGVGLPGEVLGGTGVRSILGRAEQLGGRATLETGPDGGALLSWEVPMEPPIALDGPRPSGPPDIDLTAAGPDLSRDEVGAARPRRSSHTASTPTMWWSASDRVGPSSPGRTGHQSWPWGLRVARCGATSMVTRPGTCGAASSTACARSRSKPTFRFAATGPGSAGGSTWPSPPTHTAASTSMLS